MRGTEGIAWTVGLAGGAAALLAGLIWMANRSSSTTPSPSPQPPSPPRPSPQPNPGGGYICPDGSVAPDPSQCTYPTGG